MKKVLVIGSINVDRTIEVKRMPKVGETIFGTQLALSCGGKGANQAFAAARLGADVSMIGVIGEDEDGKRSLQNLEDQGVNCRGIHQTSTVTGNATILVDESGQNLIIVVPGANDECDKEKIDLNFLGTFDIIMMQFEIPIETIHYVLSNKRSDQMVVLDPAPSNSSFWSLPLSQVDFLTPNETELSDLLGSEVGDVGSADTLLEKGIKNLLITMGDKGVIWRTGEDTVHVSAKKVTAVDSTAAGDTFNGAFVAAIAKDLSVVEALEFAVKAAALSVSRKGAQDSIPSLEQVEAFH